MIQQISIGKATCAILSLLFAAGCQQTPPSATQPKPVEEVTSVTVEDTAISAAFPFEKKMIEVNGSQMAYVDEGEGPVVLFLHGNPTSSYLWRNIIPYVTDNHRAIAVDLIGMGDSGKPDISYTFEDHAAYLDSFITELGLTDITLVVHDWGSALGMRYARLNEENVRGLAFMEAIIPPVFPAPSFEALGENGELFQNLRTPGVGEELVLENNFFVETVLPEFGVVRTLTAAEMDAYRAPFPTPESRIPTLQWPREIPIGGEPASTTAEITANGTWLSTTDMPKLLFYAEPGAIVPAPAVEFLQANVKNMESISIGPGSHFIQEDNPQAIGEGLLAWLNR